VPDEITGTETTDGLIENIDNQGNHFNIFARNLFSDSFDGCSGILVDAPVARATDRGMELALGIRPYWVEYKACDIRNWDYEVNPISKKKELSLVVLHERVTKKKGFFLREEETQYRVLFLNEARKPAWQLWTQVKSVGSGEISYLVTEEGTFEKQEQIPFAIVGDLCDKPPLLDLAYKNIEHYQTYSDYKSIIHKTCVPMLWTAGMDGEAPKSIGGSNWWRLSEQGKMGFAEPAGNSIEKTRVCLEDIKADMALLGLAMLASDRRANADVTATEKLLDSIQETSTLQVRATQLKDALELALDFTALYLGKDEGGSIELGATWAEMVVSAQELAALSSLVDLGQLSLESFLWVLEKTGKLPPDITAEEEIVRIKGELTDETLNPPTPLNPNSSPGDIQKVTNGKQNPPNPTQAKGAAAPAAQ